MEMILEALWGAGIYEALALATTENTQPNAVCPGGWSSLTSSRLLQSPIAGWFILAAFQYVPSV